MAFGQPGITDHQVTGDESHFDRFLPFHVQLGAGTPGFGRVIILALGAMFFDPSQGAGIFLRIINSLVHAAQKFRHVKGLDPHAEMLLEERLIHNRTGNAHGDPAHAEVGFAAHERGGQAGPGELQQLGLYVRRQALIAAILHIPAVNTERRQPLLGVARQHGGQINRPGPFRAVKTPHGLGNGRRHVHRFRAVAPAGRHRQRDAHTGAGEFFRAGGRFRHPADAGVGDDAFHRLTVGITEGGGNQLGGGFGLRHRLVFQRFADAAETTVNGGANPDFGWGTGEDG